MSRLTIKIVIATILLLIFAFAEFRYFSNRKKTLKEANLCGNEEYLAHLRMEYKKMKTQWQNASSSKDKDRILRNMENIEQKIIQIEEKM